MKLIIEILSIIFYFHKNIYIYKLRIFNDQEPIILKAGSAISGTVSLLSDLVGDTDCIAKPLIL